MREAKTENDILNAIREGTAIWNRKHGIDKDSLILKFTRENHWARSYANLLKKGIIKEEWAAMLRYRMVVIDEYLPTMSGPKPVVESWYEDDCKPIKFGWFISIVPKGDETMISSVSAPFEKE